MPGLQTQVGEIGIDGKRDEGKTLCGDEQSRIAGGLDIAKGSGLDHNVRVTNDILTWQLREKFV
jgi:hypothetical protein